MATTTAHRSTGFRSVHTLDETLAALADLGEAATILAGGTDVMVQYLRGEITPEWLLHIEHVAELAGADTSGDTVSLGALVSHRRTATDSRLSSGLPALAEACATVGGWQTQEIGTVVGNVCNASPAADALPPLLVADSIVHLASSAGRRSLPLEDFVTGRRSTASRADELVTGLELEPVASSTGEAYLKIAPRTAMEVAVIGLAVRLTMAGGTVTRARVAAGAVAPIPFRCRDAEAVLTGSDLEAEAVGEAAQLLARQAQPIDDARASASYRRRVVARALARTVDLARTRAVER